MEKYTKGVLEPIVKNSLCMTQVMRALGLKISGGMHSHLSRKIKGLGLDTSHFVGHKYQVGRKIHKKHWSEVLILRNGSDRRTSTETLVRALKESGRPYKCEGCGLRGKWCGKPIKLQVDHLNQDWTDDRKENLQFKCPNCHSQTEHWCGRRSKHQVCQSCGNEKTRGTVMCRSCAQKRRTTGRRRKSVRPPLNALLGEIGQLGFSAVGRKYGVTDNAIRKWIAYATRSDGRVP